MQRISVDAKESKRPKSGWRSLNLRAIVDETCYSQRSLKQGELDAG